MYQSKVSPYISFSYNDKCFRDESGFSQAEAGVKTSIKVSDKINLSQNFNYVHSLAGDIENQFYGGISLSASF